jgi:hypothetical protein
MNTEELARHARRIADATNEGTVRGRSVEALEFLRVYAGERSAFYQRLKAEAEASHPGYLTETVRAVLQAYIDFLENGLGNGMSVERKAQIDVVSDILGSAKDLLQEDSVHPATPTVIIGAALEEFLRNWVEEQPLTLSGKRPSIDAYAKALREAELITRQDIKDIESWAGLRNHAAHGEWDEVGDRRRVSLMLEGVNLFMRKYGAST